MPSDWDGRLGLQGGTRKPPHRVQVFRKAGPKPMVMMLWQALMADENRRIPRRLAEKRPLSPAAERALAEAAAAPGRARPAGHCPAKGIRRAERARADPLWRLGKEGPDVGFLTGGPYNRCNRTIAFLHAPRDICARFADSAISRIMIRSARLLSVTGRGFSVLLAGTIFAAGLLAGALIAPVAASRGDGIRPPEPAAARPADTFVSPPRTSRRGAARGRRRHLRGAGASVARPRHHHAGAAARHRRAGDEGALRRRARAGRSRARRAARDPRSGRGRHLARHARQVRRPRRSPTRSTRATPDVSAALLDAGAARRYSGGQRDGWCP